MPWLSSLTTEKAYQVRLHQSDVSVVENMELEGICILELEVFRHSSPSVRPSFRLQ